LPIDQALANIDLLLTESHKARYSDPSRMVYLAELAQAAANRIDPSALPAEELADLHASVWAELGNAYRLADFLDHSQAAFEQALDAYERGSGNLAILSLIANRFATLLCHLRRFSEAFELLERLADRHAARQEWHQAGRALILRGAYSANSGDPKGCIYFTSKGLQWITPSEEPTLILNGVHNLLSSAADLGFFFLVAELLPQVRHLYEGLPLQLLQLRWLEGRVAAGLKDFSTARESLEAAREGFAASGLVYLSSLVSLDLALLLASQGLWGEIVPLAERVLESFRALRIGREAIMTLVILRRACERGDGDTAKIREQLESLRVVLRNWEAGSG
jgi:tetratricopeptide (TPR) repeat protein